MVGTYVLKVDLVILIVGPPIQAGTTKTRSEFSIDPIFVIVFRAPFAQFCAKLCQSLKNYFFIFS